MRNNCSFEVGSEGKSLDEMGYFYVYCGILRMFRLREENVKM